MPNWSTNKSGTTPQDAPFHPGAMRYLKKIGVWADGDQTWHDARFARVKKVKAAWNEAAYGSGHLIR